ncbi:MAG: hypothetical protein U0573_02380 [Phycisphaerales bacterium]
MAAAGFLLLAFVWAPRLYLDNRRIRKRTASFASALPAGVWSSQGARQLPAPDGVVWPRVLFRAHSTERWTPTLEIVRHLISVGRSWGYGSLTRLGVRVGCPIPDFALRPDTGLLDRDLLGREKRISAGMRTPFADWIVSPPTAAASVASLPEQVLQAMRGAACESWAFRSGWLLLESDGVSSVLALEEMVARVQAVAAGLETCPSHATSAD